MQSLALQRHLNGVKIRPYDNFDVGVHLCKLRNSKKTDLTQKQLEHLYYFLLSFYKIKEPAKAYDLKPKQLFM